MRVSKQFQSLPLLHNITPSGEENTIPTVQKPNPENKFKMLKKTFLSSKTKLRKLIQRETETSYSLKRKMKGLSEKLSTTPDYLISLKNAYNNMEDMTVKKQKQTKKIKEEIQQINKKISLHSKYDQNQKDQIQQLEKQYQQVKQKQQSSVSQSNILSHILDRMKKDQTLTQQRIDKLELNLSKIKNQLRISHNKKLQLLQSQQLYSNITKQIKTVYSESQNKRAKDLEYYQSQLNKIILISEKQQQQTLMTQQIQDLATSDINEANTKNWRKLLMIQIFVRKMLKFKINHFEKKYEDVKEAFFRIRLKTPINNPSKILQGYQYLQNSTQDLLETIKFLQQKQILLKEQKNSLINECEVQQDRFYQIIQSKNKVDQIQKQSLCRKAKEISSKCLSIQLLEEKLFNWCHQNQNRFNILEGKQSLEINLPVQYHKLASKFNSFCDYLVEKKSLLVSNQQSNNLNLQQLQSLENVVYGVIRKKDSDRIGNETYAYKKKRSRN